MSYPQVDPEARNQAQAFYLGAERNICWEVENWKREGNAVNRGYDIKNLN